MRRIVWCVIACLVTIISVAVPSYAVADADLDLTQALNGDVPGLTAAVNGSDLGYYGDSLRAHFQNDTGQTLTVHVPIGLRLLPENTGVQTMYTAGDEVLVVPPGASEALIKGFCGEAHDAGPGSEDMFTPGGLATGGLLRTLQRINQHQAFNPDGQLAVWSRTDAYDPSESALATRLAGGGSVPSSRAAAGGAAAAVAAGGAAVFARKRGKVSPAADTVVVARLQSRRNPSMRRTSPALTLAPLPPMRETWSSRTTSRNRRRPTKTSSRPRRSLRRRTRRPRRAARSRQPRNRTPPHHR